MPFDQTTAIDYAAWASRVNARWIVHDGLSKNAESYMSYLRQCDPDRLILSCRNAYLMVWQRDSTEDPKPWFYGGLFSLATGDEAAKFISNHWMTLMTLSLAQEKENATQPLDSGVICQATMEKIQRLRQAVARLP